MTGPTPESTYTTVILRGYFNPQIFQPAWLAAKGLIREAESDDAKIGVIYPEVVAYEIDWAKIEVQRDQLAIETTSSTQTPEQIRDLALGAIQTLSNTPIHELAFRYSAHFPLADEEERDRLIGTFVAADPWERILAGSQMRTLRMQRWGKQEGTDLNEGVVVSIEPSVDIHPNGLYISVRHIFQVAEENQPALGSEPACSAMERTWDASVANAKRIIDSIFRSL